MRENEEENEALVALFQPAESVSHVLSRVREDLCQAWQGKGRRDTRPEQTVYRS